uniref:ORF4 n=1 Tax=Zoothera dauma adenovirus TaxID=3073259 RepID=A0AA51RLI3_9ADEN|nr:ORF4 [Zoothera dauma adenovirus]
MGLNPFLAWDIILSIHKTLLKRFATTYLNTLNDIPLIDDYHDEINKTVLCRYGLEYPDPFKTAQLLVKDINICEALLLITECASTACHASDLRMTADLTKREIDMMNLIENLLEYCDKLFRHKAFISRLYYSFQIIAASNLNISSYNSMAYQMTKQIGVDRAIQTTIKTLQQMMDEVIAAANDVKLFSRLRTRLH